MPHVCACMHMCMCVFLCVCVLVTRACADVACPGGPPWPCLLALARLRGCGLRALPPAQPPAMARHAALTAAGVPQVPQRTRMGSEA